MLFTNLFMSLKNFCQSSNKMKKSTPVCSICNSEKSLCGCCEAENITSNKDWNCKEKNDYNFLNQCIFCEGKHLCSTGSNPDCIYKYNGNYVAAIEIKDQPENSIEYNILVKKIKNFYDKSIEQNLIPSVFILQISNAKNTDEGLYSLQDSCTYGLGNYGFSIGYGGTLFSSNENLAYIKCRFFVVKCAELTEDLFFQLLQTDA